jgi:hypothetical protein
MSVTFVGAGTLVASATNPAISVSSHASTLTGDILIAQFINKATLNGVSAPDGTWTEFMAEDNGSNFTVWAHWKRATADGAQAFTFTKDNDDNVCFAGYVTSWRGCPAAGSPLDATTRGVTHTTSAADNVSFPAYDPTAADVHAVFVAFYGNDLTTFAAAMSADTNPDCTVRSDQETGTGTDASIAITSGDNDGSNIAARTWASASSADAANTGLVFALKAGAPQTVTPGKATLTTALFAASVILGTVVAPGAAALTTTRFAPTVAVAGSVTVVPDTAALALTPYAPSVTGSPPPAPPPVGATVRPYTVGRLTYFRAWARLEARGEP